MKDDHRGDICNFCSCEKNAISAVSGTSQNFFQASFCNCKSCIYNTNDHPSFNSSLCSSHIWFSYIRNFMITIVDHQNCYYKVGTDLDV